MADLITVYASIGNSDDKLSQMNWNGFHLLFSTLIRNHAKQVYGDWSSLSTDPWQNACIGFSVTPDEAEFLKRELRELAAEFQQDSIAWAVAPVTEFLGAPSTETSGV